MDSFDVSSDSEEGLLDEIVVGGNYHQQHLQHLQHQQQQSSSHQAASAYYQHFSTHKQYYEANISPIHYCDNATHLDDNIYSTQENQQKQHNPNQPMQMHVGAATNNIGPAAAAAATFTVTTNNSIDQNAATMLEDAHTDNSASSSAAATAPSTHFATSANNVACSLYASTSAAVAGASFNHQLTADMCNYKNSKSRRLEYSLKGLKYGRSNPSQDSAFGSLTDNDLSMGSSSFRLSSFQSVSSPIDEGVEDIIIATTTAGHETCLELATIPRSMVSQDSAISSPCRESSPSNFLNIDEAVSSSCSAGSSSSGSTHNIRPQHFPVSLSPKILVTATTNSSSSSLASNGAAAPPQTQQFDPPKILVNDQNSIYTTSPSKRSGTIEVFSQKYRVSSFEDMSPNKRPASASSGKHLKNVNRLAFRSLEEERRIDSAFMPICDRTNSENRVNMQSEKYKKLTHASFRISKTSSQVVVYDTSPGSLVNSTPGSTSMIASGNACALEIQRPATASGTSSNRQTMWRDSKFYRKNRIAKSNDSLLETSPNHSARLSPSSLRDNHYDSCSSYGSRSHSRQSLNRGSSINEISGSNQTLGIGLTLTTSFCGNSTVGSGRRYCSSKSEDLGESNDYLRVMDARKSYSERHLVTLTKLRQTAINSTTSGTEQCCLSEDDLSFNDDNNAYGYKYQHEQQQRQRHFYQQQPQHAQQEHHYTKRAHPQELSWSSCSINRLKTTNIKTTSLATLPCPQNLMHPASTAASSPSTSAASSSTETRSPHIPRNPAFKSLDRTLNMGDSSGGSYAGSATCTTTDENSSSPDESSSRQTLSGAELSKIFAMDDAPGSSCSEEKTPLLDSVEMSPMSPTEPDVEHGEQM